MNIALGKVIKQVMVPIIRKGQPLPIQERFVCAQTVLRHSSRGRYCTRSCFSVQVADPRIS